MRRNSRKRRTHDDANGLGDTVLGDKLLPNNNTKDSPSLVLRAQRVLVVSECIPRYEEALLVSVVLSILHVLLCGNQRRISN